MLSRLSLRGLKVMKHDIRSGRFICRTQTLAHTHTHTDIMTHTHRIFGSFTSSLTKPWHAANTQYTLMWKPYCMCCVSINVCVLFSPWWMCNEVAEAYIQQLSIYELLTFERRGLNITPSWNNPTSLRPASQGFTRKADDSVQRGSQ